MTRSMIARAMSAQAQAFRVNHRYVHERAFAWLLPKTSCDFSTGVGFDNSGTYDLSRAARKHMARTPEWRPMSNIVEVADKAGTFKTLMTAVKTAGMTSTLEGKGPFTIFAPNDAAFSKLPKGAIDSLLADIPRLKKILNYHVVPGDVRAADVAKLHDVKTVEGSNLHVHVDGGVKVNQASVIGTDIVSDNGVIHVIDAVLMPEK
jgi:uncharacterized surface protein with fasciclin (FAS1) repeats